MRVQNYSHIRVYWHCKTCKERGFVEVDKNTIIKDLLYRINANHNVFCSGVPEFGEYY